MNPDPPNHPERAPGRPDRRRDGAAHVDPPGAPPGPGAGPADDGGQTLLIVALVLVVLSVSVGFAVDLGLLNRRAGQAQQAADAAALAVAVVAAETTDPTLLEEEAVELALANGFDGLDPDVGVEVEDLGDGRVRVVVTEQRIPMLFLGGLVGDRSVQRSAVARFAGCGRCELTLPLRAPLDAVDVSGSGDGFVPIPVGERIFAINHKTRPGAKVLICIDRLTNAPCPGYPKALTSVAGSGGTWGDMYTNVTPTAVAIGARIYYAGQRELDAGVGCWNTATDTSCGYVPLALLPALSNQQFSVRVGGPVVVDGDLYLISDDLRVHCVRVPELSPCLGYPRASGLAAAGLPPLVPLGGKSPPIDIQVVGSRLYAVQQYESTHTLGAVVVEPGGRLHCFDTALDAPCPGFGGGTGHVTTMGLSGSGAAGQLFVRRDTSAQPDGVCVNRYDRHECFGLDGAPLEPVAGLGALIHGTNFDVYRELDLGGRTFFPGGYLKHSTICWDWTTASGCGTTVWGATGDYGYALDGDCFIGLGHHAVFWSFDQEFERPCADASVEGELELRPCACRDGETRWADVVLRGADLAPGVDFSSFVVTLRNAATGELMASLDLLGGDGAVDLTFLDPSVDRLAVTVDAEAVGDHAWRDGEPPVLAFHIGDRPVLVE
ncbi:MAG: pilus assembly protein TadG-related protein [Actinomycetota bacterium]|nr:pilus assembly protein TadG-related protein [Actinomycetota bacterium]